MRVDVAVGGWAWAWDPEEAGGEEDAAGVRLPTGDVDFSGEARLRRDGSWLGGMTSRTAGSEEDGGGRLWGRADRGEWEAL